MSQLATVPTFAHHLHPEEVTPQIRERMAHNIGIDHMIWAGFIALIGAILGVGTAIVDSVDKVSPAIYWHIGAIVVAALWAELICYLVFDTRKRFVLGMPVATAVVVKHRDVVSASGGVPCVQVRYLPKLKEKFDVDLLRSAEEAFTAWVDLDGLSIPFEQNLQIGDLVTILYDPARPSHIRIVEFEH